MIPKAHQFEKAELCWSILKETGYVYLMGKPRSGKSLTSVVTAEKSTTISNVLIITTKNALGYPKKRDDQGNLVKDKNGKEILVTNKNSKLYVPDHEEGWLKTIKLASHWLKHNYHIYTYDQVGKVRNNKVLLNIKPEDYDLVIIDESHYLSVLGKPTGRYKVIKALCYNMPHIHLSGTAIVESPNGIYHQMTISEYTPFTHKNFYHFHREFGKPYYIKVGGREVNQYDKAEMELLMPRINEFSVYMTQEDAGISKDVQAEDVIHYVTLNQETKDLYNTLQEDQIVAIGEHELVCDTEMKLRTSCHMLESGVAKIFDEYVELGNTEKIDYIKQTFGDTNDVGIMCHYIGERQLLAKHFKYAELYSSTAHAEGVDLSHLKHFVVLSASYSGAKWIQLRDRIINVNGSNTTKVNILLVKGAVSEQAYKRTSQKEDFNNSTYERTTI